MFVLIYFKTQRYIYNLPLTGESHQLMMEDYLEIKAITKTINESKYNFLSFFVIRIKYIT